MYGIVELVNEMKIERERAKKIERGSLFQYTRQFHGKIKLQGYKWKLPETLTLQSGHRLFSSMNGGGPIGSGSNPSNEQLQLEGPCFCEKRFLTDIFVWFVWFVLVFSSCK